MNTYIAFLRGINVGGNSLIRMADLKQALLDAGLVNARTYIQSGNIIFESDQTDVDAHAAHIKQMIKQIFAMDVDAAVFSRKEWQQIIAAKPAWWGVDAAWKHNLMILIKPYDLDALHAAFDHLKPDIERVEFGNRVVYQSLLFVKFGQTTSTKIVGTPVYKQMTIRNYNTATKLLQLLG